MNITLDARDPDFFEEMDDPFDEEAVPTDADFSHWDNEFLDEWAPEQGVGPRKGHIRKAFINSAVDERLAESIFHIIDASKPAGSLRLETAKFTVEPGGWTGDGLTCSAGDICQMMATRWIVSRGARDDKRDQIEARPRSSDCSKLGMYCAQPANSDIRSRIVEEWETVGPVAIFSRSLPWCGLMGR